MWQAIKNVYHLFNAFLANLWFGFPSRHLTVIGVTGTDGKTTTTSLIYHILHSAGYNASMISSVGAVIGGKEYDVGFHVTTPSPWALQRFIKKAVVSDALRSHSEFDEFSVARGPATPFPPASARSSLSAFGGSNELRAVGSPSSRVTPRSDHAKAPRASSFIVLETTSHALDQHRVWGIKFDVGVLTNVTHEHLDYHKTYENYVQTKAKLLKKSSVTVVNMDDESYNLIKLKVKSQKSKVQGKSQKFITYGMGNNADIDPKVFHFKTNMVGEFNKYNILAAVAACKALGISDKDIRRGIESFNPPIGREEVVYKNSFTVMIDFAHTPNAFEQILSSIRPSIKGRLIHVFGAAGERDASKRPLMGKVSSKYSDVVVLTGEDPRSESVGKIMEEISAGIINPKSDPSADGRNPKQIQNSKLKTQNQIRVLKIPNRQEAIESAIRMAGKRDFVLITGKSHEKSMNYGKGEEPWDEYEVVSQAINKRRDEK